MSESGPTFRIERSDAAALALAVLLAFYHAHLLGRGAYAWPDEHLYRDAWAGVRGLQNGDVREFARAVTGFGARPLEALLRVPSAWLQLWLEDDHGVPRNARESMQIPTSMNVVISFLLTMVFYRLSRWFFEGRRSLALLATLLYSLLVSTNIWIRHVLPYDTALVFALAALIFVLKVQTEAFERSVIWVCVKALLPAGILTLAYPVVFFRYRAAAIPVVVASLIALGWALWKLSAHGDPRTTRMAAIAGVVAALGTATYPAYYSLPAVFAALIFVGAQSAKLFERQAIQIRAFCVYAAASGLVMLTFELLARLGNVSYLGTAARLSGTIALGNFDEGYVFLPRYFTTAEGAIGITLIVLAAAYVPLRLMRKNTSRNDLDVSRLAILLCAAYLVYATQSVGFHKMAFTERYIRMYVPALVWAAISTIALIRSRTLRLTIAAWCVVASLSSFVTFARDYDRIGYPLDALRDLRIGFEDVVAEQRVDEVQIYPKYNLPVKDMVAAPFWITRPGDRRFYLVNFGWFWPEGPRLPQFVPPTHARIIYDAPHFLTFRSAPFEGWMPARRREFEERRYRLRVYRSGLAERPSPPSSEPSVPGDSK